MQPLVSESAELAYFDSGDVYFNLAKSRHLRMPENSVLMNARFGGVTGASLTTSPDYVQQIHSYGPNPYMLVTAVRGAEFQALSKRGRFTSSSDVSAANAIAPGGLHMQLQKNAGQYFVKVVDGPPVNRHKPSVDVLFRSASECGGRDVLGVDTGCV